MKKVLFIDRDGTIINEPADKQIDSFEKLQFMSGVIANIHRIAAELDYELVMVTNQDGLGTSSFPEGTFWPVQNFIIDLLEGEGVTFEDIFIDDSFPDENKPTRKPGTEMLKKYIYGDYDLENSYVIGDRRSDMELAENLGCSGILVREADTKNAMLSTTDWDEIYSYLKNQAGHSAVTRTTNETDIQVELNLYGAGESDISTGLPFFDHMLEQLARHGDMDLNIQAEGDLEVDAHHTIEDVAITLGRVFDRALGSKKGLQRYGFLLPMDDCLAQVAVDFGGRPWLKWEVNFERPMIGDVPTEMFRHFFKSFSDYAKCNLNIKAEGENEHHKIESIFKGFARAAKQAVWRTGNTNIPSTKGSL